jgi:hypothetical protein
MNLPPNVSTCASGANCTPMAQASLAQSNQRASMSALKSATTGGAVTVNELPPTFGGPANTQMQASYVAANRTANQAAANSAYDNQAKTGGKTRSKKRSGKTRSGKTRRTKRRRHWSAKYKRSINCKRPKGFSQRQHCKYGRKRS